MFKIFAFLYSRCLLTQICSLYVSLVVVPTPAMMPAALGILFLSLGNFTHNKRGHSGCTQMCLHSDQ